MKRFHLAAVALLVTTCAAHAAPPVLERSAAADAPSADGETLRPRYLRARPSASAEQRVADADLFATMAKDLPTLPNYTKSFKRTIVNAQRGALAPLGGVVAFQHTVIGTDPSSVALQGLLGVASYVPVRLIPVVITGTDGTVYDPATELVPGRVNSTLTFDQASPVFTYQPITIGGNAYGTTQLLDAWVRGERWQYAQFLPNYHLYLTSSVGTPLSLSPNASQMRDASGDSLADGTTAGQRLSRALVLDQTWFNQQMEDYVKAQGITPDTIPVFVTSYDIAAANISIGGYHFNVGTQTYIWHTYTVAKNPPAGAPVDGMVLEHELAELIDHPYPNTATFDGGSCLQFGYESGDPLEFTQADFTVTDPAGLVYRFQDLTYAAWNEGEAPSTARSGRYTMQNAFRYPCF